MDKEPLGPRLYRLLEGSRLRGWTAVVQSGLFLLIFVNVLAVVLETVPRIAHEHHRLFERLEWFSVGVFAIEYAARVYACTSGNDPRYQHPLWGRVRFVLTPMALVDLLAISPLFLFIALGVNLGSLRIVRLLRVLKLMRYSPATAALGRVIYNERKSLGGAFVIFQVVLLLSSTVTYYAERHAQPVNFGSIPAAMWWAMAALTTVGYGDVMPTTTLGRVMGSLITLIGIGVIALPTGIVASAFLEESRRRDFTITWALLAEVPFFQRLKAPRIADLVRIVRPRFARGGEVIMRKGEAGESMFVIASGDVEVDLGTGRDPVLLRPGDFFGELALLERVTRTATVRALDECKLLELDADDLRRLMKQHPELDEAVRRVAAERRSPTSTV